MVGRDKRLEESEDGVEGETGDERRSDEGEDQREDFRLDRGLRGGLSIEEDGDDVEREGKVVEVGLGDERLEVQDESRNSFDGKGVSKPVTGNTW